MKFKVPKNFSQKRRSFLFILSSGLVTLAYNACSSGFHTNLQDTVDSASRSNTSSENGPVWLDIPTLSFTQGVPSRISVANYVSDPKGFSLALSKNSVALPAGVTFDVTTKSFIYDGIGAVGSTDGHILTATEI